MSNIQIYRSSLKFQKKKKIAHQFLTSRYTQKKIMLFVVYLDKGRFLTPLNLQKPGSEIPQRYFKKYKLTNKQHMYKFTAAFSR